MEEEDTCRICRSGPEEDTPLYHPCKCSGSIAKVHQDCLIDWLQHSKKKSCELCNTELRFHKVYSPTMPAKLPYYLYVRRFFIQSLYGVRFGMRAIFVAAFWLAILPLMNLGIWRLHFMIVDVIIWSLLGGAPPGHPASNIANSTDVQANTSAIQNISNATSLLTASAPLSSALNNTISSNSTILNTTVPNLVATFSFGNPFPLLLVDKVTIRIINSADLKKVFDKLGHDVFEGQILTCAIVVCFVAIFLLREWCLQNMPQAVDGLAFAGEAVVPPAPAPMPVPLPQMPQPVEEQGNGDADQGGDENEEEFKDELEELSKRLASSTESIENDILADATSRRQRDGLLEGGSEQPLRPRLTNDVVPDPPEVQSTSNQHRSAVNRIEGPSGEDALDVPHTIEELRRLRAARFGKKAEAASATMPSKADAIEPKDDDEADVWQDIEEDTFVNVDKGKGREAPQDSIGSSMGTSLEEANGMHTSVYNRENRGGNHDQADSVEESTDMNEPLIAPAEEALPAANEANPQAEVFGQAANVAVEAQAGGGVVQANDWEDEAEGADRLEDDLDGVMEAIGMRGPLYNLVTNLLMMFVLCSFVLAFAVALPYLVGRSFGVGSNFIKFVRLPMQGLRYISDPVVDFLIEHGGKVLRRSLESVGVSTSLLKPKDTLSSNTSNPNLSLIKNSIMSILTSSESTRSSISIVSEHVPSWKEAIKVSLLSLGPSLYHYYKETTLSLHSIYIIAEAKTLGTTQQDRIFCVLLGQFYWIISLFIQQRLGALYIRMNLKWLKTSVEQQLVVLKVLAFICLELIIFPWCCGLLLDITLLPLWKDVSISSRWLLMQNSPLSVCFTQWALGTLYMFSLAMFASTTRGVVRSGVLCFVRDAGDPTFHPIKDILERRALEQLRKIGLSGAIYAAIMLATFGTTTTILRLSNNVTQILPLRWEMHQALSTTGLELLFIAIVMPPLVKSWLPVYILRKSFKNWWKYTAQFLRISSYLMGGRHPAEEGSYIRTTFKSKLLQQTATIGNAVTFVKDGGFARVPADDHAIMSTPIVIYCDESGRPLTERGKEAFKKQSEAMAKMTKRPKYTIVYLPPHFKSRIIALIGLLWLTICSCFSIILLAPLLLGRFMTTALLPITEYPLHDGYSWIFGAVSLGLMAQLYQSTRRIIKSSNRKRRVIRMMRRFAEYTWMVVSMSILSCLLGIIYEQYINGISKIAFTSENAKMPDISFFHSLAMGLLIHHIVAQIYEMQPNSTTDWDKALFNRMTGFLFLYEIRGPQNRRPRIWHLTKKGFLPAALYYLFVISAPLGVLTCWQHIFGKPSTNRDANLQIHLVYTFCLVILEAPTNLLARVITRWTALIRDEHFLISTELKNHPTHANKSNGDGVKQDTIAEIHSANGNADDKGGPTDEGPIPDVVLNQ